MDLTKRIHQYTRGAWTFDVIDSGPIDGPLVVLLHGFQKLPIVGSRLRNYYMSINLEHLRSINVVIV